MKRQPKSVATAPGNDQSQPVQTGSDVSTTTDSAAASGTDTTVDQTDTGAGQGDSPPSSGDSVETPAPATTAETPAATSSDPTLPLEPAPVADTASAPTAERIEVRVLVTYDNYLPNDVIVMDRAEAEIRFDQVDADPIAVAYAKSLIA